VMLLPMPSMLAAGWAKQLAASSTPGVDGLLATASSSKMATRTVIL
jgi:hypothetical protein